MARRGWQLSKEISNSTAYFSLDRLGGLGLHSTPSLMSQQGRKAGENMKIHEGSV